MKDFFKDRPLLQAYIAVVSTVELILIIFTLKV